MLSVLLLACAVVSALGVDIKDNPGTEIVGDYKLVFAWPKTTQAIPNCAAANYKHRPIDGSFDCNCGRQDANLARLWQGTKFVGMSIVFDIVTSFDEAARALADTCRCEPFNLNRVVALKLSDNLMLQYEQEEILRHYIFAKTIPSEDELREAISTIKELKYEDGMLVCKNNKND